MEIVQILPVLGFKQDEINRKMLRVCAGIQDFSIGVRSLEDKGVIFQHATVEYRSHGSRSQYVEYFQCCFSFITSHSLNFLNGKWDNVVVFYTTLDANKNEKTFKAAALRLARSSFEERMGKLAQELERQAEAFRNQAKNQ